MFSTYSTLKSSPIKLGTGGQLLCSDIPLSVFCSICEVSVKYHRTHAADERGKGKSTNFEPTVHRQPVSLRQFLFCNLLSFSSVFLSLCVT